MLQHLSIENYALIKELQIDFSKGFSVITGETGAGKSIILGALGLILGQRADSQSLLDKETKCVIEGVFDISSLNLSSFFAENDLDEDAKCILRREITPNGKSRAFINDTPVSLLQMKTLGESLVDIHSQHKTLSLSESSFQLDLLNLFAKAQNTLQNYSRTFAIYCETQKQLEQLRQDEQESKRNQDYFQFLFNELQEAQLENDNQEALESELSLQTHAETIKTTLQQVNGVLDGNEICVLQQLNFVKSQLQKIQNHHKTVGELNERLNSAFFELKDIVSELNHFEEGIEFSPELQEQLSKKLNKIYHLQQKHQVSSLEDLLAIEADLESKLQNIAGFETQIIAKEKESQELEKQLLELSSELTAQRKKAALEIEGKIKPVLSALGMPNGLLKIRMEPLPHFSSTGKDKISFLFSANLGNSPDEIIKVASGGELSRLMLAIKSLITENTLLPTIIFDEIDSGVSGEISLKVADIMSKMSKNMQVIAITHLPQIAAKASSHFKVYKQDIEQKTVSSIKKLADEERIREIATMLSSENPTEAALKTAKELMTNSL